jgi:hypothetical protein
LRFALKTSQCLRVASNFIGQELEGYKTMEPGVFRLVHNTHAATSEFLDDAIVRDGLADHWPEMVRLLTGQVNESRGVGAISKGWLAQNPVSNNVGAVKHFLSVLLRAL